MKFVKIKIDEYCVKNSIDIPDYLLELEKETNLTKLMPQMLSGRLQGRVLSFLSRIVNPKKILEIGTFTGYSALCLAEGLPANGKLITIEYNNELKEIITRYIKKSPFNKNIELIIDDAKMALDNLSGNIDLVFLDASKEDYLLYYKKIIPKLNKGGIIVADNVLWSGKVINDINDKTAKAINEFNEYVQNDIRTENIMLPIRDGLSIIRVL